VHPLPERIQVWLVQSRQNRPRLPEDLQNRPTACLDGLT